MKVLRLLLPAALLPGVLACAKDSASPRPSASPPQEARAAAPPPAAEPDTVGCGAIPKAQFAEPEVLVREWVRRDTLAYFLTADDRLFELMACPGHLGGGDEVIVATDPVIQPAGTAADTALFLITYRQLGRVHADTSGVRLIFVSEPGVDSVRVPVVRTAYGWRFPYDVANPHLSPATVLRAMAGAWEPASREHLVALQAQSAP